MEIMDFTVIAEDVREGDLVPLCRSTMGVRDDLICVTGRSWGLLGIVFAGYSLMTGETFSLPAIRPNRDVIVFERN